MSEVSFLRVLFNKIVDGICTLMIGIGLFLIIIAPAEFGMALLGIIFLSAGVLMIYFRYFRVRREEVPARPPLPTGGATEVRQRASEETVVMTSSPAKTTVVRLATLSSPRGNIHITDIVQEFGRLDFTGIVPEENLKLISRRHFRTRLQGGKLYIEDLGSTNGTFVNEVDIRGKGLIPLQRGDRVNIAGVVDLTVEY